jgi:hypothetical protein
VHAKQVTSREARDDRCSRREREAEQRLEHHPARIKNKNVRVSAMTQSATGDKDGNN